MSASERARIERIVQPLVPYLSALRADEIIAVSSGDLESAEQYHAQYKMVLAKSRTVLEQWKTAKQYPTAQRMLRRVLANAI